MLWLYILLGILLVITLLMLIPVRLKLSYHKELICILYIGFVKLALYPPKYKKNKKEDSEKEIEKKPEKKKKKTNLIKEKGLDWLIDVIKRVSNLAKDALKDFFRHIIVKRFMLSIKVAGDDAADTAVKYGYCCSAVYPAVGLIVGAVKCKKYGIDISPDFEENAEPDADIDLEAKILVFRLVTLIIKHGYKGLKLLLALKDKENDYGTSDWTSYGHNNEQNQGNG